MSIKQTFIFFVGTMLGVAGTFMKITSTAGGDYVQGCSAGILLTFMVDIIPKLLKKKNETIAR